jgi:hypothetical protein
MCRATRPVIPQASGPLREPAKAKLGIPHFHRLKQGCTPTAAQIERRLHPDRSQKITEKIVSYELDRVFVVNPTRYPGT